MIHPSHIDDLIQLSHEIKQLEWDLKDTQVRISALATDNLGMLMDKEYSIQSWLELKKAQLQKVLDIHSTWLAGLSA